MLLFFFGQLAITHLYIITILSNINCGQHFPSSYIYLICVACKFPIFYYLSVIYTSISLDIYSSPIFTLSPFYLILSAVSTYPLHIFTVTAWCVSSPSLLFTCHLYFDLTGHLYIPNLFTTIILSYVNCSQHISTSHPLPRDLLVISSGQQSIAQQYITIISFYLSISPILSVDIYPSTSVTLFCLYLSRNSYHIDTTRTFLCVKLASSDIPPKRLSSSFLSCRQAASRAPRPHETRLSHLPVDTQHL